MSVFNCYVLPSVNKVVTTAAAAVTTTTSLVVLHGQFNVSLSENHHSLYDLNVFDLSVNLDINISPYEDLLKNQIQSRYFSPHSFEEAKSKWAKLPSCFSTLRNNVVSLNHNLENFQVYILEEFLFDIIGISVTKITNSNLGTFQHTFLDTTLNSFRHLYPLEVSACL